jgi:hypothetical protein
MERRKIVAALDDHDYEQVALLAAMNKIKIPEMVRRIVKAHLDGTKTRFRGEECEG